MQYTVKSLAERYDVHVHSVLSWIASGELKATDIRRSNTNRAYWRISEEAVKQFEESRTAGVQPRRKKRRRRQAVAPEVY